MTEKLLRRLYLPLNFTRQKSIINVILRNRGLIAAGIRKTPSLVNCKTILYGDRAHETMEEMSKSFSIISPLKASSALFLALMSVGRKFSPYSSHTTISIKGIKSKTAMFMLGILVR